MAELSEVLSPEALRLHTWLWSQACADAAIKDGVIADRHEMAVAGAELRQRGLWRPDLPSPFSLRR
jgi:hypothetical protein